MNNKEAIAILTHNWKYRELIDNSYQFEALDLAIKALENARPQGEWISRATNGLFNQGRYCSLCGRTVEFSENFCPNCGADMRGGRE